MRCTCYSDPHGKCDYHTWKDAVSNRSLARRKQRNYERNLRHLMTPGSSQDRSPRGKKLRLADRWKARDRFALAKEMGQEESRIRHALKRMMPSRFFVLSPYSREVINA